MEHSNESMAAKLHLAGHLKALIGGRDAVDVESGLTVRESLAVLGIVPDTIALVVVNEEQQTKDYVLKDGDVVRVIAVIGGG